MQRDLSNWVRVWHPKKISQQGNALTFNSFSHWQKLVVGGCLGELCIDKFH